MDTEPALRNMPVIVVTELRSHEEMSWLKLCAKINIYCIFVTELVSHPEMSLLKDVDVDVLPNIYCISLTELVIHAEISWLKDSAP